MERVNDVMLVSIRALVVHDLPVEKPHSHEALIHAVDIDIASSRP